MILWTCIQLLTLFLFFISIFFLAVHWARYTIWQQSKLPPHSLYYAIFFRPKSVRIFSKSLKFYYTYVYLLLEIKYKFFHKNIKITNCFQFEVRFMQTGTIQIYDVICRILWFQGWHLYQSHKGQIVISSVVFIFIFLLNSQQYCMMLPYH